MERYSTLDAVLKPPAPPKPKPAYQPLDEVFKPAPQTSTPSYAHGQMSEQIRAASSMAGIPFDIAYKLVKQESGFDPRARNPSGAAGLTQLMPGTAKMLGVSDVYNPTENLAGGFHYLSQQYKRFGSWRNALAAYNWGPENVADWLKRGASLAALPRETRDYVRIIGGGADAVALKPSAPKRKTTVASILPKAGEVASTNNRQVASLIAPPPNTPYNPPVNPMDVASPDELPADQRPGPGSTFQDASSERVHGWLTKIAGHQELPYILMDAQGRDNAEHRNGNMFQLLADPKSWTGRAWELYKTDPVAAMDEFGAGSNAQNKFMAAHGDVFSNFMQAHPTTNAAVTFLAEMVNPMSWAEGAGVGKILGGLGRIGRVTRAAGGAAEAVGLGSPFRAPTSVTGKSIFQRGGIEGEQWLKGTIASLYHADNLSAAMMKDVFSGLDEAEQTEVLRLSQGLKPNQMLASSPDLLRRANLLRNDIRHVTAEQMRTRILKRENVYNPNTYFPMSKAYDFGEQNELVQRLRGGSNPGSGITKGRPKTYDNYDQSLASGLLDNDFSPAQNYLTWRRQRTQAVAFEDAMNRAPQSLAKPSTKAARAAYKGGSTDYVWTRKVVADASRRLSSPYMRSAFISPELWEFFSEHGGLQKFIGSHGSYLPGGEQTWGSRVVSLFRQAIISNPVFHPEVNVAGNDAATRSLHGLGGPLWETGGYAYNATKAVALQLGLVKPKQFIGTAQEYSHWVDRAIVKGSTAEFGAPRKSMLGSDYATVVSQKIKGYAPKTWMRRLDKAMTTFSDWNRDRTFGDKGERAFAVSLFKDAIERGHMDDATAASVVRKGLGDYYAMDPQSKWSLMFLFMPWLKSNAEFWANTLLKKPQYVTAPLHALRNVNEGQSPEAFQGQGHDPGEFSIAQGTDAGGNPQFLSLPFVGRLASDEANIVGGAVSGDPGTSLSALDKVLEGHANIFTRIGADALYTTGHLFETKDVRGPETGDYHMIFNPKAPKQAQLAQIAKYVVSVGLPLPFASFVWQNAVRRGFSSKDIADALTMAGGLGYPSQQMSEDTRRAIGHAKSLFLSRYYQTRSSGDNQGLNEAWADYLDALRSAGAIR